MTPLLSMMGISKRFGATQALDNVSLEAAQGEVLSLVGENGSGKSTLMKILSGAQAPDSGSMTLNGEEYRPRNPLDARNRGVAMIYQELSLCPDLDIAENILLGLEEAKFGVINRAEAVRRSREALTLLGYPDLDIGTPVRKLNIAIRQVVEIARAVALGSKIVVLDEPTSSLTHTDTDRLFEVVETLRREGHAVIYISHFLEEVKRLSDRLLVLRDGKNAGVRNTAEVTPDEIVSMMVGRDIDELYPRSPRIPGEAILAVTDLETAKGISSFELRRGEVLGIAGLNGSGRSELLRAIFGLDKVKAGCVRVGLVEGLGRPQDRWRQGVGMLSEDRKEEGLALGMTIADNLFLTKLPPIISKAKEETEGANWIDQMGIRCQGPSQAAGDLSGGNQQKVAIGRLLHHGVDVLLMDEPTRGIDVGSKQQIYGLIDGLAKEGKAVLVVSSYLPELLGICDRIAVMHKGELGPSKPTADRNSEEMMREAAGG
jgi:ribose transport system ATP-binding protein